MSHQLVRFEPDESLIADLASESAMLDGLAESLVPVGDKGFAAGLFEIGPAEPLLEVLRLDLPGFDQAEDCAVHQDRLEHFGQVERERKTPVSRLVQV